jgi:cell division septum initiation protein DivIVA
MSATRTTTPTDDRAAVRTPRDGDSRAPEQIERDIRDTRAEVGATLDAIQSKLTPGQMMDQALGYLRTSLPADFGRNMNETVRNNPLPVALVGIGLVWMMASGRSGSAVHSPRMGARRHDESWQESDSGGDGLRDKAQHASDRAREVAGQARERIAGGADSMRERMATTASGARERVSDLAHRTREQMGHARERASVMVNEQPLLVGALGVALGAAVGAALPETRREDELMGGLRDDLMARGSDKARAYADRATDTAREMLDRGTERAHREVDATAEKV